jgi:hypothetical protein
MCYFTEWRDDGTDQTIDDLCADRSGRDLGGSSGSQSALCSVGDVRTALVAAETVSYRIRSRTRPSAC